MMKNYESTYEDLVNKTGKPKYGLQENQEYKTLNNLNPEFIKDLFRLCVTKIVATEREI